MREHQRVEPQLGLHGPELPEVAEELHDVTQRGLRAVEVARIAVQLDQGGRGGDRDQPVERPGVPQPVGLGHPVVLAPGGPHHQPHGAQHRVGARGRGLARRVDHLDREVPVAVLVGGMPASTRQSKPYGAQERPSLRALSMPCW